MMTTADATASEPEAVQEAQACTNLINSFNKMTVGDTCGSTEPAMISILSIFRKKAAPIEDGFKPEGELRRYLECYATEEGRFQEITEKYMPLIAAAAKTFKLPKTLLACLIFRESRFNIDAVSPSGAFGLGQHTNGNQETIQDEIEVPLPMSAKEKKRIDAIHARLKANTDSGKEDTEQDRKDRNLFKTKADTAKRRRNWELYFGELKRKKLFDEKADVPRMISRPALRDPRIAIGATAFYLQTILMHFQSRLDQDLRVGHPDGDGPNFDLLLAAAGAYNLGHGAARKLLANIEPPDQKVWIEKLMKSNQETAKHILSIRNCMESSASPGNNAWKGPIGSPNNACNAAPEPGVQVGDKNKLPGEYKTGFKTAQMKPTKKTKAEIKAEAKAAGKATATAGEKAGVTAAAAKPNVKPDIKPKLVLPVKVDLKAASKAPASAPATKKKK
jgi:hypothetical protein